jgi:hypothetical protein
MEEQDLLHLTLPGHVLGSCFRRRNLQRRGVCIFVREDQIYNKIDISHHCREQVLEICAIQLETKGSAFIILSLYIAPSCDFNQFIKRLDATFKYLKNPKSEFFNLWQHKYRLSQ